jgi:hypothetical protein
VAILGPAVSLGTAWLPWWTDRELAMRTAGFLLSMFGVALVIADIREKTRAFNKPSISGRIKAWLSRRPALFVSRGSTVQLRSVSVGSTSTSSGTMTARVRKTATVEDRVAGLEEDVRELRDELSKAKGEISLRRAGLLKPQSMSSPSASRICPSAG